MNILCSARILTWSIKSELPARLSVNHKLDRPESRRHAVTGPSGSVYFPGGVFCAFDLLVFLRAFCAVGFALVLARVPVFFLGALAGFG